MARYSKVGAYRVGVSEDGVKIVRFKGALKFLKFSIADAIYAGDTWPRAAFFRRRYFECARGLIPLAGRRSSDSCSGFGATACAACMAIDELIVASFIWENTMRAADAIAPNLPPPPEERRPVSEIQPLYP